MPNIRHFGFHYPNALHLAIARQIEYNTLLNFSIYNIQKDIIENNILWSRHMSAVQMCVTFDFTYNHTGI